MYVSSDAVAQEVVQETWIGVIRGIDRFEGRSSLRTWLLRIVANLAKTRAVRDARSVPFSALHGADADDDGPSVAPDRFYGPGERWAGHWSVASRSGAGRSTSCSGRRRALGSPQRSSHCRKPSAA
jgi:RNA polymerase sigma-70 factor (ECF subfamily)